MQKMFFKISVLFLTVFGLFMAIQAVTGKAQAPAAAQTPDYCAEEYQDPTTQKNVKPIYNNIKLGAEDVITLYHTRMNTEFNKYISKMITSVSAAVDSGKIDPNAAPPGVDPDTSIPLPCKDANYSTYCVAQKLLTDPGWGYMAYEKALDCRAGQYFDTKDEQLSYSDYVETVLSAGVSTPSTVKETAGPVYQAQKALEISARIDALKREKQDSKNTLDQTLSAYNELRTAWPMHKEYMKIYKSLLTFRDKMVEIRHQVEEFPSKFIDATTTKCT
jgi:hypothetical protein